VLEVRLIQKPEIRILKTPEMPSIRTDPLKNTAGKALNALLRHYYLKQGIEIGFIKKLPLKSGLGSSAASAVGAVCAVNHLLALNLKKTDILTFALEGEKISTGPRAHIDNLAACLHGGFVIVRDQDPPDIISVPVPDNLYCVILYPHLQIGTAGARKIIPHKISTEKAVRQWANTASLVAALYRSDYQLLKKAVTDHVAEPLRSAKIPYFGELREISLRSGAAGFGISGSGPAVFALADGPDSADHVAQEIHRFYQSKKIPFDIFRSGINKTGTSVIPI
jgi:homoserine kinase